MNKVSGFKFVSPRAIVRGMPLAASLWLLLAAPVVTWAAEERGPDPRAESTVRVRVTGGDSAATQSALDAAMARVDAALAGKEAALARAEASIDVREIRESIRKAIEDANLHGAMISRRTSGDEVVKGNPYSSREVREFKQTLGDGTVISRQSTRLLARDRDGRLRQELRQPDGTARVFINDPVAREVLIIDPQKRVACKAGFDKTAINDCFNQTKGDWKPLGFSFNSGKNGVGMMTANDDLIVEVSPQAQIIDLTEKILPRLSAPIAPLPPLGSAAPVPPVPSPPRTGRSATGAAENTTVTRERKTNQPYEGLSVDVDRTIETIAAGSIGNNKAIESVYERYYSPELKMTVYVRRSDPRNGESVYRMTDVKRTDPDASVFKLPSGYTVTEGKR